MIKTLEKGTIDDFSVLKSSYRILKICDSCGAESSPQWRHAKVSREKWNRDLCGTCSRTRDHQRVKTRYNRKLKAGKPGDYIMLWDERRNRYVGEHQLVMEKITGFQVVNSGWQVHHINGKKDDNSPSNLFPVPNNASHRNLHAQLERIAFDLVRRGVILFDDRKGEYVIESSTKLGTMPFSLGFEDVALRQQKAKVISRSEIDISSEVIRGITLDIPLIASNMSTVTNVEFCILLEELGALGVLHRAASDEVLQQWTCEISKKNKWVAVSVGIGASQLDLAKKLIRKNANIIFIDVAHGYCNPVIELGRKIKQFAPDVHIVVGNTTHPGLFAESAEFASAIKVGIAQGFACETKNTAGVTEKQFSALQRCALASKTYELPMISDGGVREPADLVKAIATGASCAMAGKIFAACPESAALLNEKGDKIYAGMASRFVQEQWHGIVKNGAPEGGTRYLPIGESAADLLKRYAGSLRSGISYTGSVNIPELRDNADFVVMFNATL
ncbi:hypothetical protein LCGC14_0977440 [marine sediment metagenome]|uniref:GMP reductase n=1 Tax=marine sediment metagenome TaxID=412755 RepID=A0A0F9RGE4_9ZZZZ